MQKTTFIEIDAKEIKDVLIAYLKEKVQADVDEDSFRCLMKTAYLPLTGEGIRTLDRCRIALK